MLIHEERSLSNTCCVILRLYLKTQVTLKSFCEGIKIKTKYGNQNLNLFLYTLRVDLNTL